MTTLLAGLGYNGIDEAYVTTLIGTFDSDHSGAIDVDEFTQVLSFLV